MVLGDVKDTIISRVLGVLSGNENSGNFYMGRLRWAPAPQGCVWNGRTVEICSGALPLSYISVANATTNIPHVADIQADVSGLC